MGHRELHEHTGPIPASNAAYLHVRLFCGNHHTYTVIYSYHSPRKPASITCTKQNLASLQLETVAAVLQTMPIHLEKMAISNFMEPKTTPRRSTPHPVLRTKQGSIKGYPELIFEPCLGCGAFGRGVILVFLTRAQKPVRSNSRLLQERGGLLQPLHLIKNGILPRRGFWITA